MPITRYPYRAGNITTRQAVELIAAVVSPNEYQPAVRKRVRDLIRYAREKGSLPKLKSDKFDATEFFGWALGRPKWRALAQLEGLPRAPVVGHASITLPMIRVKGYGMAIPDDPQKLRDEFCRIEVERMKLIEEVAELKSHIAELEAEVDRSREKDRSQRAKSSESGKKGGRGKTL